MKLSPGQVREVLEISPETFRHWRTALAPLEARKGYRPCFTHGDLLAMAFVKALTDDAGIRVAYLKSIAVSLFKHCSGQSWAGIERTVLIIEPSRSRIRFIPETQIPQPEGVGIVVPCRPIVTSLRERLRMETEVIDQENLRFPPTMVSAEGRRRRAL